MATSAADFGEESLSIISVVYQNERFLQRNVDLTRWLNPSFDERWLIVDNNRDDRPVSISGHGKIRVLPGVARPQARDAGSLHHAMALEKALQEVTSRYVLLMDPDFYVIRRGWIDSVLSNIRDGKLGLLGSVWHPRWFHQYRDFPSVHFMLIDLQRIAIEDIDLKPEISDDRWWQLINRHATPIPNALRETLKAQRCRDTGWRIYRRYRHDPAVRTEVLLPHYVPPDDRRWRWERKLGAVMPASWCKYPIDRSRYTEGSFLRESLPMAYELGWEEFYWRGAPFAFHLRRVGRPMAGMSTDDDLALVDAFLKQMIEKQR